MALTVVKEDSRFRVEWQGGSIDWLPDTPSNRKAVMVFLRLLRDEEGKPLFTFQELSWIVGSENRQASSGHMEDFRECGSDFLDFLTRKRKVNSEVVEAVSQQLLADPLAKISELRDRVNIRLGRDDLTEANIRVALEQIPSGQIRGAVKSQIAKGEAHYQEEYLLEEMMKSSSCDVGQKAGIQIPESEGMNISDPASIRKLVTPDIPVSSIKNPLRWVVFCMVLYYEGIRLSVLGRWLKVHKTTILRWILGLGLALWPVVYKWIVDGVKAKIVYIDEKWLKIRGKWCYWFVVLDAETGLPILASLLASRSKWACRWIGVKLKHIGKIPGVIITDGLLSYHYIMEGVKHFLCHFHHQQGVTRWLREKFHDKEEIAKRKPEMKKVFQTNDKRTVRRRLQKLKESAGELDIKGWVQQTEDNLPKLLPSVEVSLLSLIHI